MLCVCTPPPSRSCPAVPSPPAADSSSCGHRTTTPGQGWGCWSIWSYSWFAFLLARCLGTASYWVQLHQDNWPKKPRWHLTVSGSEPVLEAVEDLGKSLVDVDRDLPGVRQLLLHDRQLGLDKVGVQCWSHQMTILNMLPSAPPRPAAPASPVSWLSPAGGQVPIYSSLWSTSLNIHFTYMHFITLYWTWLWSTIMYCTSLPYFIMYYTVLYYSVECKILVFNRPGVSGAVLPTASWFIH